ncbi:lipoyl(octanoyl) transferase LipB [Arboricoccus pini]|nr:lipoyl(octanoyl) transferase LipB [Arboricoccus pini]
MCAERSLPADAASATNLADWEVAQAPVPYPQALARMEAHADAIRAGTASDLVWLLEHEPVYTAGTSADPRELIGRPDIPVFEAGRGGRYTYHGPGQRVAYLILDLKPYGSDLRRHVWRLEEMVIRTLAEFDIKAERRQGRIGVWVETQEGEMKIAAIGVRVRRWVAFHGLSLNVDPALADFAGIVPCGIAEFGVTSMAALGRPAPMTAVDAALLRHFKAVFGQDRQAGNVAALSL